MPDDVKLDLLRDDILFGTSFYEATDDGYRRLDPAEHVGDIDDG